MKIIQIFVWSITVTLAFVYAVIFQWTLFPPTMNVSKIGIIASGSEKKEGSFDLSGKSQCTGWDIEGTVCALVWKYTDGSGIVLATSSRNLWENNYFSNLSAVVPYNTENSKNFIFFAPAERVPLTYEYGAYEKYDMQNYTLSLFDVNAKKITTLADIRELDPELFTDERGSEDFTPFWIEIINDTVFFAYGRPLDGPGFLPGGVYYVSLSNPTEKGKMNDGALGIVHQWGEYWLSGGYGDAGWGASWLHHIDTGARTVGERILSTDGPTGESITMVGLSKNKEVIIAVADSGEVNCDGCFNTKYVEVFTHKLNDGANTTTLFTKNTMPKNTYQVLFSEKKDELFLVGDTVIIYNFGASKQMEYSIHESLSRFRAVRMLEDGSMCLNSWQAPELSARAIWNMADNTVEYSDISSCESKAENESIKAQSLWPEQLEVVEM